MDLDEQARLAEAILVNRRDRQSALPADIFAEFAWEGLLHLFVADARSERLTGQALADRAGCKTAIMGRWIKYLSKEGLILDDGKHGTEVLLTLSPAGLHAMETYLARTQHLAADFSLARRDERRRDGYR
jgi:DNA-binding MarR family transcriptional regulator